MSKEDLQAELRQLEPLSMTGERYVGSSPRIEQCTEMMTFLQTIKQSRQIIPNLPQVSSIQKAYDTIRRFSELPQAARVNAVYEKAWTEALDTVDECAIAVQNRVKQLPGEIKYFGDHDPKADDDFSWMN